MILLLVAPRFLKEETDPGGDVNRGSELAIASLVSETDPLPRGRCLLRWTPGPEGSLYDLSVTTEKLDLVLERNKLTEPSYLVPAAALAQLPPGGVFYWRVEMVTPEGLRSESPTFLARIEQ